MKLLVLGREGQVARALEQCANDGVDVVRVGRPEIDLRDRLSIERAIAQYKPTLVVNPAAYTAVDRAESESDLAYAINRDGAGHVAAAAEAAGLPVIHISTDYVFSGDKATPYTEMDTPNPQNVYGASKLAGERAVSKANPSHTILRTSWIHAPWGNNFARTMLRLAQDRDVVRVVADQYGTPTYAPDIAQGILAVARFIERNPDSPDWRGTFHMTNGGETNWAGFAEVVYAYSKVSGGPFAKVEAITTADYPTPAKRPANSRLDSTQYRRTFEYLLPSWQNGVERLLHSILRAS